MIASTGRACHTGEVSSGNEFISDVNRDGTCIWRAKSARSGTAEDRPVQSEAATSPAPFMRSATSGTKKLRRLASRHPQTARQHLWHVQCKPGIDLAPPHKEETMSAEEADKTIKQDLEDTRNDLKRAADEIRVKMHLAGMDAKDAWDDIQPRLEDFERRFDSKADEVSEELKALGSDIKQRLLNIKAKLTSE